MKWFLRTHIQRSTATPCHCFQGLLEFWFCLWLCLRILWHTWGLPWIFWWTLVKIIIWLILYFFIYVLLRIRFIFSTSTIVDGGTHSDQKSWRYAVTENRMDDILGWTIYKNWMKLFKNRILNNCTCIHMMIY